MTTNETQMMFNPIDYGFRWTSDGWYEFDQQEATKKARKERDRVKKELKASGYHVLPFVMSRQRITKGGINTGHPEVDFILPVYGLDILPPC